MLAVTLVVTLAVSEVRKVPILLVSIATFSLSMRFFPFTWLTMAALLGRNLYFSLLLTLTAWFPMMIRKKIFSLLRF